MKPQTINILLADNQFLITEALSAIIQNDPDYSFSGLVKNLYDLKNTLARNPAINLLITDHTLIDYNGIKDLGELFRSNPQLRILILTNLVKVNEINEFSKIGIKNILYKTAGLDEINRAINCTMYGKKYYSDEVLDLLVNNKSERDEVAPGSGLTPAEIEITKLIASGMTTKEIAAQKHVSFHTVMSHRKNIFRKLNINNTSELIMYAIKTGLIDNIEYYI
jgi:DNA-binding NarL/FixJ family response regulator